MRLSEIAEIVNGTSDPAFAMDGSGFIVEWNQAAHAVLGISRAEVLGNLCGDAIGGADEDGMTCSADCTLRRQASTGHHLRNFDLLINTPNGKTWFNVAVIVLRIANSANPYTVHILRSVDIHKRLELILRDFILTKTDISREGAAALFASAHTLARESSLTTRESQILKLVAAGRTSVSIGNELQISPTTVDNHLQHILKKLNTHSRLEAVLRAEHSGLL